MKDYAADGVNWQGIVAPEAGKCNITLYLSNGYEVRAASRHGRRLARTPNSTTLQTTIPTATASNPQAAASGIEPSERG